MSTILFVNACMRGNDSRTLSLCKEYLATKTSDDIEEVNLDKLALSPYRVHLPPIEWKNRQKKHGKTPFLLMPNRWQKQMK